MLTIDSERLRTSMDEYARIGATPGGGVTRLALSDEDKAARDLLRTQVESLGCELLVDDLGNMRGLLQGTTALGGIQVASHLDSVIRGGRYDGALGVLAGLEVMRTLRDQSIRPSRTVELINWTNEEGARFEPAMIGSGAATGVFEANWMHDRTDPNGLRLGAELERIGYLGKQRLRPPIGRAYLELHIEQGPVLDELDVPIGIVQGILGITWIEMTITGRSDHAGPSPMEGRNDALVAAADLVLAVQTIGQAGGPPSAGTVGRLDVEPNVINTIPGQVTMSADFRASTNEQLDRLVEDLRARVAEVQERRGVSIAVERFWTSTPVTFDPGVIVAIEHACERCDVTPAYLWSGAGHDARYAADVQPAGMIFVRSRGGVSHCESEFSEHEDIALGANVLLHTVLSLAEDGVDKAN